MVRGTGMESAVKLKLSLALSVVIGLGIGVPAWGAGAPGDEGAVSADMVGEMASLAVGAGSWSQAFAPFTLGNGQEFPDQTDQQALAVAARQDPSLFAANSTRILDPPGGATVEKYLDDFSARIDIPGQGPDVIATSTTPVRVEENGVKRAVDLKLVDVGDAIEPKTPVVALSFADTLGGGITIAENIRMRIVGADRSAAATIAGQQVFYANALNDADVFAMPLPAGLETFVQLRSSDSPKTITYQFDLPKGARLVALPGEQAGIAIVRDDDLLAMIDAPVSKDANDVVVPTTTSIHGTRLSLHVAADDSTAYPILVDPVVTDNQFLNGDSASSNGQFQNTLGWRRETSGALGNFTFAPNADNPGSGGSCYRIVNNAWVPLDRQLCVSTQNTRNYPGEIGQWAWRPPGGSRTYLNDGAGITFDGYVYRAFVRHSYTRFTGSRGAYMFAGIKSGRTGQWIGMNRNIQQSGVADDVRYGPWTFGENTTTSISNPSFLRDYCANTACSPESTDPNIDGASFAFGTYALGYGHALSANAQGAVFYQYDRTPPSVTHASNSDLSDWKDSGTIDTVISSSDKGMGVKRVGIVGGSGQSITSSCTGGILSNCPQNPPAQTISTDMASFATDGVQQITSYADDILDKRTYTASPLTVKVDRTPPDLGAPSGSLWDARNRSDDRRYQGVYASSATLKATATDASSGVAEIEVFFDGVSQRSRGGYAAGGALDWNWNLATQGIADGTYTVTIVARDRVAGQPGAADSRHKTTSAPFTITVDRSGDVYAGRFASGDPDAGGEVHAREWARAGSSTARRELAGHSVATRASAPCADGATNRACESVRIRTRIGASATNDTDDFTILRGDADDPDLQNVSQLLAPGRDSRAPAETGDLVSIARPWQILPPAHGSQFQRFDFVEQRDESEPAEPDGGQSGATRAVKQRLYVDATTKMPVRQVELDSAGQTADETFWTYDLDRKESSSYPADFFAVSEPATPNERVEVQQQRTRSMSSAQDRETSSSFQPSFLGSTMIMPGVGTFCLARNDLNIVTPNTADGDTVPVGEEDPDIPDAVAYAKDTFVTAAYHLSLDATCRPGLIPSDVALTVTTLARESTNAASWRAVFEEDGSALPLDPQSPWLLQQGLLPVTVNLQPTIAYLVPGVAENTSALMDVGDATIIVTGPFNTSTLTLIASQLRSQ